MAERKSKKLGNSDAQKSGEIREFRKTNEAIGLRVKEGRFSLLSRKVFNVLVYHAQQLRAPGINAPIATEASKKYFWIPLVDVARDAAYDSKDTLKLKEHLEELLNIRIVTEDFAQWTSQRLLSAVTLVNPLGLNKRGGQLWLGFAFPPEVEILVMSPENYTKLTFFYQTQFRSGASLALYEICRRFLTNPSKLTYKNPWEWWYGSLTGNPVDEVIPEYKFVKRDVFKRAIAEINTVTDINIELIEHKQGRKVISLQFKVVESAQSPLNLPAPPVIDTEILERLMGFGINQKEASDLLATTPEGKLLATIKLVEDRNSKTNVSKLVSPAAYFKQALRESYASPAMIAKQSVIQKDKPSDVETPDELVRRYLAQRAKEGFNSFKELPDPDQEELRREFKQVTKLPQSVKSTGMASAAYRNEFSFWYAERIWASPSQDDLIKFAISNPKDRTVS